MNPTRCMKKGLSLVIGLVLLFVVHGQELYVFSEPASNMPTNSISAKMSAMFSNDNHSSRTLQRYMPEVMFGLNKNWMVHGSETFQRFLHRPQRPGC